MPKKLFKWFFVSIVISCHSSSTDEELNKEAARIDSLDSAQKSIQKNKVAAIDTTSRPKKLPQECVSMQKYSYLLVLMNNADTIGNATGFFVKKCDKIFLLSNFHVLADRDFQTFSPLPDKWNRILIRYSMKDRWQYFSFDLKNIFDDIDRSIKKTLPADIWSTPITGINEKYLNIIDIDSPAIFDPNISVDSSAFYFGFPSEDHKKEKNYNNRKPYLISGALISYDKKELNENNMAPVISQSGKAGSSGAPVFAYYQITKNGKLITKVKFLGIYFANVGAQNSDMHSQVFRSDVVDKFIQCK